MKKHLSIAEAERGFTIIEMMISLVIFTVAVGMAYQVMNVGVRQRNTINTRVDAMKSSRIGLNYIRRDVVNAGMGYHNIGGLVPDNWTNSIIGAAADTNSEQDFLTGVIVGNDVSTNLLNPGVKMDSIGMVVRDLTFNDGKDINFFGTDQTGTSVVVKTAKGDTASCKPYDLYLFITGTTQVVGLVTSIDTSDTKFDALTLAVGTADPLKINLPANGTGNGKSVLTGATVKGSFKKVILTTYSIDSSGNLIRKTYGNQTGQPAAAQIDSKPLISNVKDFQINYLLDSGTFTSDPTGGNNGRDNQQKMNSVVEVEVILTVMQQDSSLPQDTAPIPVREIISTRNLRYKIS